MSDTPQPSTPHRTLSALAIGVCLIPFSLGLSAFAATYDVCIVFGGLCITPVPAVLLVAQYFATWRYSLRATRVAIACNWIVASMMVLIGALTFVTYFIDDSRYACAMFLSFAAAAGLFTALAIQNHRWAWVLWEHRASTLEAGARMSVKELLLATTVIALATGLTTYFIREQGPSSRINATANQTPIQVPESATNICYAKGGRGYFVVEFTTDEAGFRKWADELLERIKQEQRQECAEIVRTEEVHRALSLYSDPAGPDLVEVSSGLTFGWKFDLDEGAKAVFDRATGRVYFVNY